MSSTDLTLDQRDISFAISEWLQLGKLNNSEKYAEFDQDTLKMMVQEGIRFAIEVVFPTRAESDRKGCRLEEGRVKVSECLHKPFQKAYELGWASISDSPEYGGMGAPATIGLIVSEAINGANLGLGMFFGLTSGAAKLIETYGSDMLKEKYIAKMFQGQYTGTMCLSEPHAGSDVGAGITSAKPMGNGVYKIKGTKCWISSGDNDNKMGIHSSPTAVLSFGENDDCLGWILGSEGQGIAAMFQMMNTARIFTGLIGLSLAGAAYENAKTYAHERVQGTNISKIRDLNAQRVSIIEHPAVRLNLINMKSRVEAMRALLYYTALQFDLEKIAETEKEKENRQNMIDLLTPMCKGWCTEVGLEVVQAGLQVMGGVGYTKDFPLEQLYRDARISTIYEGTTDIQALDLIGRKILRNDGALFQQLMGNYNELINEHRDHQEMGQLINIFEGYCESLYETSLSTQEILKKQGMESIALYATPFLMFISSVTAGWLLLQQAVVASEQLSRIRSKEGLEDLDDSELLVENENALFYSNKLKTARYFLEAVIPQYHALLEGGKKQNFDALEITF